MELIVIPWQEVGGGRQAQARAEPGLATEGEGGDPPPPYMIPPPGPSFHLYLEKSTSLTHFSLFGAGREIGCRMAQHKNVCPPPPPPPPRRGIWPTSAVGCVWGAVAFQTERSPPPPGLAVQQCPVLKPFFTQSAIV